MSLITVDMLKCHRFFSIKASTLSSDGGKTIWTSYIIIINSCI